MIPHALQEEKHFKCTLWYAQVDIKNSRLCHCSETLSQDKIFLKRHGMELQLQGRACQGCMRPWVASMASIIKQQQLQKNSGFLRKEEKKDGGKGKGQKAVCAQVVSSSVDGVGLWRQALTCIGVSYCTLHETGACQAMPCFRRFHLPKLKHILLSQIEGRINLHPVWEASYHLWPALTVALRLILLYTKHHHW